MSAISIRNRDLSSYFFQKTSNKTINWFVFFTYIFLFSFLKLSFHELWKDEWQAWHVARDMSWSELFGFLYYEGHPCLWYVYLKCAATLKSIFTATISEELFLQLSHLIPFIASAFLVVFRFRFSIWLKIGVLLSFFLCFEYGMVNRGYVFVMLCSFYLFSILHDWEKRIFLFTSLLIVLCQTEVQGVIIAGGIVFYVLVKSIFEKKLSETVKNSNLQLLFGGLLLGVFLFTISVFPRGNAEDLARAYNGNKLPLAESMATAFQGLLANTFLIGSIPDTSAFGVSTTGIALSLLLAVALAYFFIKEKPLLLTFGLTFLVFYFFSAFLYSGGIRQWGILFLFFIGLLTIFAQRETHLGWLRSCILLLIFGFQLYYNFLAVSKEIRFPYSNAKATAIFLKEKVQEKVPIVAINKFQTGAVVGYLNRKVFAMPEGTPFTHFKWLEKVYIPNEGELKLFAQYKSSNGLVIVSGEPLDTKRFPSAQLWRSFDSYNIKGENFYVYVLAK